MTQLADPLPAPLPLAEAPAERLNLLRFPLVKRLLTHRLFQFALILPGLVVFVLVILTGLFGTPVGNANFSIIFVWIVWWALLIMLLIPLGGRVWCTMCPIPAVGEWVQRKGVVDRRGGRPFSLGKDWPRPLRNIWLQNFAFLGVAAFSAVVLTRPFVTGALLLGFMVVALALFLVYRRRVFCRYVCPVSGFIGLYSTVAPLEIRVIDQDVCLRHCGVKGKECAKGSAAGYGCPWMEYPGTLARNSYCGMCTECLKTCPQDNLALNVRPFGTDLLVPKRHLDEAFKGFIMLGAAVLYSIVMLGRWGWIKEWANLGSGSLAHFAAYAALLVAAVMVVMPALFYGVSAAARLYSRAQTVPVRQLFVSFAYTTVPLGLAAWVAFSFSFLLINVSYAIPVVSDPFGWGWNLFGTAGYAWTPYFPELLPYLQVPVLAVGLMASIRLGQRIALENFGDAAQAGRAALPVSVLLTALTLALVWLYIG